MNPFGSKEEARAWRERWCLVTEAKRHELRTMSMETKLQQLAAMMRMGRALGWNETNDSEVDRVRALWVRLKSKVRHAE